MRLNDEHKSFPVRIYNLSCTENGSLSSLSNGAFLLHLPPGVWRNSYINLQSTIEIQQHFFSQADMGCVSLLLQLYKSTSKKIYLSESEVVSAKNCVAPKA